jgi:hypothetical protein
MNPERDRRARELEERATAAIHRIHGEGANPTWEALLLANQYTDELEARVRARLRPSAGTGSAASSAHGDGGSD